MQKIIKKHLLSFLSTKWGFAILFIGVIGIINSLLAIFHHLLPENTPDITSYFNNINNINPNAFYKPGDNLLGKNYEVELGRGPIDVVYTWVNGSDPLLQKNLAYWKKAMG